MAIIASITGAGNAHNVRCEDSTSTHGWAVITGATTNSWKYTPANTGDRLRFVVTASDQCSGIVQKVSAPIIFTVNAVTAIAPDPGAEYGVSIFPNPASDVLYLRNLNLSRQWQSLSITGMDGKRIIIEKDIRGVTGVDLAVTSVPSGMYMLVLKGKSGKRAYYKVILRR